MITAAIWLGWAAVYGIYCQNPLLLTDRPSTGERYRSVAVTIGVLATIAAAVLLTIAVNR